MLTTDAGPQPSRPSAVGPKVDAPRVGHGVRERNGLPVEPRRAHVDPVGPGSQTLAGDDPGLGLDLDAVDAELPAQPIRDAARAVAASARERAVVVVDEHVGGGSRRPWIAHDHQLIVVEARRPMDGARVLRRSARQAIPACRARGSCCLLRSCARSAPSERMAGGQTLNLPSRSRARGAPRGRADLSIARAPSRTTASRKSSSSIDEAAARAAAWAASFGAGGMVRLSFSGGSGPCRKAIFSTQRQPRCAFTRAMMTAALCCASSAKAPSTLMTRVAGAIGASGSRLAARGGHLQLDRPGVTGDGFANDRRPIGDQARFSQAPRGQCLRDERGSEFGEQLGAGARALHHRLDVGMVNCMNANVSALRSKAKRNAIVASYACMVGTLPPRARLARSARGNADPYRVWLSEVLLQQTTAQAATPYYQAFIAKWPRVEDLAAAPGRSGDERFRGSRLLFASAEPARLRQGDRSARWAISERGGEFTRASGRRRLYRRGDRGDRLRPPNRAGRRQYRPRSGAARRPRRADRSSAKRDRDGGARAGAAR